MNNNNFRSVSSVPISSSEHVINGNSLVCKKKSGESSWLSIGFVFSVFLGVSSVIDSGVFARLTGFNLPGQLTLQDLMFGILAPFLYFTNKPERWIKLLASVILLWLFIQIATDFFREIPNEDKLRGIGRVLFFGCGFVSLALWLKRDRVRISAFLLGLGLEAALSYYLRPTLGSFGDPWKWHFAFALTLIVLAVLVGVSAIKSKFFWILFFVSLGLASVFQNYRSHAGMCIVVAAYYWWGEYFRRLYLWLRVCCLLGGAVGVLYLYIFVASSGLVGDAARNKLEMQFREEDGVLSIIAKGRTEYKASFQAIKDSPIIGYGSWARHPEYVYLLWDPQDGDFNAEEFSVMVDLGIIPTHSFLFGAWVDGGVLPGLFWICIWLVVAYAFLSMPTEFGWPPKLAAFACILLLWDILFSPFGSGARTHAAFFMVSIFSCCGLWLPVRRRAWWLSKK